MSEKGQLYMRYNTHTRRQLVTAKMSNPKLTYRILAKRYNIGCVETARHWVKAFKSKGETSFIDHRLSQKGGNKQRNCG